MFPKSIRTAWVVKSLADANVSTADLKPYQVGIFNQSTYKALANGTSFTGARDVIFACGSPNVGQSHVNVRPRVFTNVGNVNESFKSEPVFGHNIDRVWVSNPNKEVLPNIVYLGWDGVSLSKDLKFQCGRTYEIEVTVHGDAVRNVFGKDVREAFEVTTPCCATSAPDAYVNTSTLIDDVINRMNSGYIVSRFIKAEKVMNCCENYTAPTKTNFTVFEMSICDEGDSIALARVQGQYTETVTRVARVGATSTYQLTRIATGGTPTAFSTQDVVLQDCDTCPAGFTAVNNSFAYTLNKVDAGDAGALTTIASTYGITSPESVIRLSYEFGTSKYLVFSSTALTSSGTNEVQTVTITGTPTGGTFTLTFAGETTAAIAYNANAAAVQAALVALGNVNSGDIVVTGGALPGTAVTLTFGGQFAGTNVPQLTATSSLTGGTTPAVAVATTTGGVAGEVLVSLGEGNSFCLQTTPTTSAWTSVKTVYKITRDLVAIITLDRCDDSGATDLAAITAFYANNPSIVGGSIELVNDDSCKGQFKLTQYSEGYMEDGCDTLAIAKFLPLASYKGYPWTVNLDEGWTENGNGCPVPPTVTLPTCQFGIKITGAFVDQRTGSCAFDIFDKREYDAVRVEVTLRQVTTNFENCTWLNDQVTVAQYPTFEQLSGQEVLRDIIKYRYYLRELYFSPSAANAAKWTRAEGLEYGVDVDKHYYAVHILHNVKKVTNNTASEPQLREEIVFYFEESDVNLMNQFLQKLNSYTSSVGIQLPVVV